MAACADAAPLVTLQCICVLGPPGQALSAPAHHLVLLFLPGGETGLCAAKDRRLDLNCSRCSEDAGAPAELQNMTYFCFLSDAATRLHITRSCEEGRQSVWFECVGLPGCFASIVCWHQYKSSTEQTHRGRRAKR